MGYDFGIVDMRIVPVTAVSDTKLAALLAELETQFKSDSSYLVFSLDDKTKTISVGLRYDDPGYYAEDELQEFASLMSDYPEFEVQGTAHFEDCDVSQLFEFHNGELEEAECRWLGDCAPCVVNALQDIANTHDYDDIRWFADLDRHALEVIRDWYTEYLQK